MKYEVINKSWSKRRKLDTPKIISHIEFSDFQKQHNHFCRMYLHYQDGSEESLLSRVVFNEVKQYWIVDGMQVAVRIIEDEEGLPG